MEKQQATKQGLIQVYTGEGKGKTTAAFGLALRAAGRGRRVVIIQFFKSRTTGEVLALEKYLPAVQVRRFHSQNRFIWEMNEEERALLREETQAGWQLAEEYLSDGSCDLLILDEVMYPVKYGFIALEELLQRLAQKFSGIEVVLTGRDAPPELLAAAHLVTEMRKVKHPFDEGIGMREGIEF